MPNTRLYLPSSGTSPLPSLAIDSQWEGSVSTFYRAPLPTAKTDTALTNKAARFGSTATRQDCWAQFVGEPLKHRYQFTATDASSIVVLVLEGNAACDAHLAYVLRVVSNDGSTVRGILKSQMTTSTEFSTSALTRILSAQAFSAVQAEIGDRLVLEVGGHGVTPSTSYDVTLRFGDPTGTSDFALTAGLSTDLCPWIEIDMDLETGTAPTGARAAYGVGTAVSITHGLTIAEGDVVVAAVHVNSSVSTCSDNNGSSPFTELRAQAITDGGAGHSISIFRRVVDGDDDLSTISFTLSAELEWSLVVTVESGINTTNPEDVSPSVDTTASSSTDGTTATSTDITTGAADSVVLAFGLTDAAAPGIVTSSPTNSYAERVRINNFPTVIYRRVVSSAGAVGTMSYTLGASNDWTVVLMALKDADAVGGSAIAPITYMHRQRRAV